MDGLSGQLLLYEAVWRCQQCAGVASTELTVAHVALDRGWQLEEAQRVRDASP
jgi:hypothetical protein